MSTIKKLWIGLAVLVILSPLGLILPAKFNAGSAWGEWSADELHNRVGYTPSGISKAENLWKAPMPDYAFKNQESSPLHTLSISYIISAVVGISLITGITFLLSRILIKREESETP